MPIQAYATKSKKLPGTNFSEVYKKAFGLYSRIKKQTKRRPYVRSKYFRRVKYFPCAIELIQNTKFNPVSKENPNEKSEVLHRFTGITSEKEIFFVQIKEDKKTDQKYLISIFPFEK